MMIIEEFEMSYTESNVNKFDTDMTVWVNKLIEKYEGTNIDPYGKFCDILKKLDFGNPFVEHVAKKTYVKTKTSNGDIHSIEFDEIETEDTFF